VRRGSGLAMGGTPPSVADEMAEWLATAGSSGLNVMLLYPPGAAAGFVRMRTMLRAAPDAVKRRRRRKRPLPDKGPCGLASLFLNRAAAFTLGALARLYTNGIFTSA